MTWWQQAFMIIGIFCVICTVIIAALVAVELIRDRSAREIEFLPDDDPGFWTRSI